MDNKYNMLKMNSLEKICITLLGLVVSVSILFSLDWSIFHDAPILHYIAWRINHGLVPYRDLFDMNMPGTYLLHLFCLRVFGESDLGFRFLDLSLLALSALAIWAFTKSHSRTYAMIGVLVFCSIHLNNGIKYAGQRDFMMLPFLLWAIFSIDRLHETGRGVHALVFSVCITAACWIKPIAVLLGLPCLIWFLISSYGVASKLRAVAIMAFSGLFISAGILLWLHGLGALEYFWRMLVDFLPLYSSIGRVNTLMEVAHFVLTLGYDLPMMIILYGLIWRYKKQIGRQLPILLIFITYGYVHYFVQQKYWSYHAYPFWASLALAIAIVMPQLRHEVSATAKLARACLLIFSLKSVIVTLSAHPAVDMPTFVTPQYHASLRNSVEKALEKNPAQKKEGSVAFFDFTQAGLWDIAYRERWVTPLRHSYSFPFYKTLHDHKLLAELEHELINDLNEKKPRIIIISYETWPYPANTIYSVLENSEPWQSIFKDEYTLFDQTIRYKVYVRK